MIDSTIEASHTSHKAPTSRSIVVSSPELSSLTTPPMGPSLHPPMNFPPIQMAGTLVRPIRSAISARIAFPGRNHQGSAIFTANCRKTNSCNCYVPSGSVSNSTTVYLAPTPSKTDLAFKQYGQLHCRRRSEKRDGVEASIRNNMPTHVVKENMKT